MHLLLESSNAYRKAIRLRLAWSYTWADFAMAKARALQIDQEFFGAMERATTLGPWEPKVMSTVAQLGVLYEPWLPETVQQAADGNLERLSQRSPWQAIKMARNAPSLEKVCRWIKNPQKFKKDCAAVLSEGS